MQWKLHMGEKNSAKIGRIECGDSSGKSSTGQLATEVYAEEREPELHGLNSWIIDFSGTISMAKTLICLERNSVCFLGPDQCHQAWAYKQDIYTKTLGQVNSAPEFKSASRACVSALVLLHRRFCID